MLCSAWNVEAADRALVFLWLPRLLVPHLLCSLPVAQRQLEDGQAPLERVFLSLGLVVAGHFGKAAQDDQNAASTTKMIPLICLVGRNLRRVDYLQGSWPDRNKAKIFSLIRDGKARRGRSLSCRTRTDPVRQVPTASAMQPAPLPRPIAANDPRRRVRMRMDRFPMSATKSKPSAHESRWPRVQEHHGGLGRIQSTEYASRRLAPPAASRVQPACSAQRVPKSPSPQQNAASSRNQALRHFLVT